MTLINIPLKDFYKRLFVRFLKEEGIYSVFFEEVNRRITYLLSFPYYKNISAKMKIKSLSKIDEYVAYVIEHNEIDTPFYWLSLKPDGGIKSNAFWANEDRKFKIMLDKWRDLSQWSTRVMRRDSLNSKYIVH